MKAGTIIALGVAAGLSYVLWRLLSGAKDQLKKATEPAAAAIAAAWLKLFPLPPSMQLLGHVKFPGNLLVPLEQLVKANAVRHSPEPNFAVYVNYAGQLWRLQPSQYGNWPAVPVTVE